VTKVLKPAEECKEEDNNMCGCPPCGGLKNPLDYCSCCSYNKCCGAKKDEDCSCTKESKIGGTDDYKKKKTLKKSARLDQGHGDIPYTDCDDKDDGAEKKPKQPDSLTKAQGRANQNPRYCGCCGDPNDGCIEKRERTVETLVLTHVVDEPAKKSCDRKKKNCSCRDGSGSDISRGSLDADKLGEIAKALYGGGGKKDERNGSDASEKRSSESRSRLVPNGWELISDMEPWMSAEDVEKAKQGATQVPSVRACAEKCAGTEKCRAFVFKEEDRMCTLGTTIPKMKPSVGFYFGKRAKEESGSPKSPTDTPSSSGGGSDAEVKETSFSTWHPSYAATNRVGYTRANIGGLEGSQQIVDMPTSVITSKVLLDTSGSSGLLSSTNNNQAVLGPKSDAPESANSSNLPSRNNGSLNSVSRKESGPGPRYRPETPEDKLHNSLGTKSPHFMECCCGMCSEQGFCGTGCCRRKKEKGRFLSSTHWIRDSCDIRAIGTIRNEESV